MTAPVRVDDARHWTHRIKFAVDIASHVGARVGRDGANADRERFGAALAPAAIAHSNTTA